MRVRRGSETVGEAIAGRDILLLEAEADLAEAAPATCFLPVNIPYGFARKFGVAITDIGGERLRLALRKGDDPRALLEVRRFLNRSFDLEFVRPERFDVILSELYAMDGQAVADAASGLGIDGNLDLFASDIPTAEDLLDITDDASAIRLINVIIADAARQGVSDIHIAPYDSGLVIRMRIDGVLHETLRMPVHLAPVIVSRIKVMARLDIAERRIPQDGQIGLTLGGKKRDVRVSTLPSRAGERVVLRILDKGNAGIGLEQLGMPEAINTAFRAALREPNGIILVTGPPDSGKTTTLYAGLQLLNDSTRNILTVEDPVEYAIDGVGQTQVNAKVGLDFATGLRAILRQDPDAVMVGEIRDRETADIAVRASLTGHLVLSTVHTNDAVGAITRMRDMKIEPFLLASTLRAVIAQRLVRRLCENCREQVYASGAVAALLGVERGVAIHEPRGCDECSHTGYNGRIGVFEAIRIDDHIRQMINAGGDESQIVRHAFLHARNLGSAARALVLRGVTTPEEAVRVSRSEDPEPADG